MSITRDRGMVVFECDECYATIETGTYDFAAARQELVEKRWTSEKVGADWWHSCKDCK